MTEIVLAANAGVHDFVETLRKRLGRWADEIKIRSAKDFSESSVRHGVRVLYNTSNPGRPQAKFTFITFDSMRIDAIFEFHLLEVQGLPYIDEWLQMINKSIESTRGERQGADPYKIKLDPMTEHIRKAIGEMGGDPDPIIEQANRWANELVGEEKLA